MAKASVGWLNTSIRYVKKHHFLAIHQSNLSEINFTHGIINLLKKVKQIYTKVNLISETFKRHQSGGYLIKSGCIHLKFSVIPLPSFPTYTKKNNNENVYHIFK